MTVGEVISLLTKHSSGQDTTLMTKDVYDIEVTEDYIDVKFTNSNEQDYRIYKNGLWKYHYQLTKEERPTTW